MSEHMNWYFPVAGPTEYSNGSWMPNTLSHRGRKHAAIDIYAERGSTIIAPVAGVVTRANFSDISGYAVTLKGDDGITYFFAHMDAQAIVAKGQRIGIGQAFGAVGNSGSAKTTKPHVHFSMSKGGKKINPFQYLDRGFKVPEFSVNASNDIPGNYAQQTDIQYVDPFDVAQGVLADSEPIEEVAQGFTPEAFLANAMGTISNMAAGGTRADYRTMGTENVARRSLIPTTVVVDEGGEPDGSQEG